MLYNLILKLLSLNNKLNSQLSRLESKFRKPLDVNIVTSSTYRLQEPLFINAIGKSASSYLVSTFLKCMTIQHQRQIAGGSEPTFLLNQRLVQEASEHNMFCNQHVLASPYNKTLINEYFSKIVIHLRDPRQATLSWLHNIERNEQTDPVLNKVLLLPKNYFEWTFEEKLKYQINERYPFNVAWIQSWIDADADPDFKTKILFTTFEQFKIDQHKFFKDILDFYSIPYKGFNFDLLPEPTSEHLYRKGKVAEWRTVFSETQIEHVNALLPSVFTQKFSWER